MGLRDEGVRESLRAQGLKQGGLRGSLRNLNSTGPDIPDSAVTQWDFSEASGTSSVADSIGSSDLSGSYTGPTATINGVQAGRFDGDDDYLVDTTLSITQPFEIYLVFRFDPFDSSSREYLFDGEGDFTTQLQKTTSPAWQIFAGSSSTGGSTDGNNHIVSAIFDGANSGVRVDGSRQFTVDVGANDLSGFTLAARGNQSAFGNIVVGDVIVFDSTLTETERDKTDSILADKWGITL